MKQWMSYFSSQNLTRSFCALLLLMFSLQVVSANFSLIQCHDQALHSHDVHAADSQEASAPHTAEKASDDHCNDLGFCMFGHCHVGHCSVVLSNNKWLVPAHQPDNSLGFGKYKDLHSLSDLDRPWQPPRA